MPHCSTAPVGPRYRESYRRGEDESGRGSDISLSGVARSRSATLRSHKHTQTHPHTHADRNSTVPDSRQSNIPAHKRKKSMLARLYHKFFFFFYIYKIKIKNKKKLSTALSHTVQQTRVQLRYVIGGYVVAVAAVAESGRSGRERETFER